MSFPRDDKELDRVLAKAYTPPLPDFDAWLSRHADAVACLDPAKTSTLTKRRTLMSRAIVVAVAACVLLCVWLGTSRFGTKGTGVEAFARTLEQIEKAKTIVWKETFYERITSKDGKRTWLKPKVQQWAYKSPGLYRMVEMQKDGNIEQIRITDATNKQQTQLTLDPVTKKAWLSELAVQQCDPNGPFEWVKKELKEANLQWVEKRKTATGEVNVFRHAMWDNANGRDWSYDFWVDQNTKRLVAVHVPGADIFDPGTAPDRDSPPEKEWSRGTLPGRVESEIAFDTDLDDSLFRLESPRGYAVETKKRPQVTEREMIDYLGVAADYNAKMFPDQVFPFMFSSDRTNKIWAKAEKDRTPAERKFLQAQDHYLRIGVYSLPVADFVDNHTVEKTFRYLGKGVKLGDKDRIVCWYKLNDTKAPKTYHVIYGDLSVKDVAPEDLPLPVSP
jgi:hypothetical protein